MSLSVGFLRFSIQGILVWDMKNVYFFLLLVACFLMAGQAHGQIGNCEYSLADGYLDVGNVRARIPNSGSLFWRGSPAVYEAPVGIGVNTIFAASIWIGGKIDNEIRTAATMYGPWEFWSGPLDEAGNPPADCSIYDQVWEIRREDIEDFLSEGIISENLAAWPWQLGAPVIDGDGDLNNYNLQGGDLPELLGDQRLWWIMNDRGNEHLRTESDPIGLEIHASAFAYAYPPPISNFTFYEYRIINKNASTFEDAYFSLFTDIDIGDFSNDYVGSDSLLHLGYAYNADSLDLACGIDIEPPAVGFTFLDGLLAKPDQLDNDRDGLVDEPGEMVGTSSVLYFTDNGRTGSPYLKEHFYNMMQGRFRDGTSLFEGNRGYDYGDWPENLEKKHTKFSYPGDPTTKSFWSEFNIDNQGTPQYKGDRWLLTSAGAFDIAPGDTADVRIAIVWSQGEDHLDSVRLLKSHTKAVRDISSSFYTPTQVAAKFESTPAFNNFELGFDQNHPNPFSSSTTLRYSLPQSMQVRLAIYDILGREVEVLVERQQEAGVYNIDFDSGDLPAGLYLARIELDHLRFTKRMVKSN